jgi:chorismate-pyruvate lyase
MISVGVNWTNCLAELCERFLIDLPPQAQSIIIHTGSSTKLLKSKVSPEQVDLNLLSQRWRGASKAELNRLCLTFNTDTSIELLERSIVMLVKNKPWIYARSYFSKQACDYLSVDLINLGNKFLGELLINKYPDIVRGGFEYAILSPKYDYDLYNNIINYLNNKTNVTGLRKIANKLIIRRSLYKLNNITLFNLDEIFLPEFSNYFK